MTQARGRCRRVAFVLACVGWVVLGCGTESAKERSGREEGDTERDDPCARVTHHVTFGLIPEGAAPPSGPERLIMEATVAQATQTCRAEGLSVAQAECILAVEDVDDLLSLGECPAIAAKKPSWLVLSPPRQPPAPAGDQGADT